MAAGITERVRERAHWGVAGGGVVVVALTLHALWGLVAPAQSGVCPAILPAPPGCADRYPTALGWTAALTAASVAVGVAVAVAARRRLAVAVVGALALCLVAAVGYRDTLYSI